MRSLPLGRNRAKKGCPLVRTRDYLSSCCQKSSSEIYPHALLLDYNFITAHKEHLESAAIIAKSSYKSLKNDDQITIPQRRCILEYLSKTLRGKREIISFENKIDEVLSLSSQLSPEARKFISEVFSNSNSNDCSSEIKKELTQYTSKIREILKDEVSLPRKKGRSQSMYPITRCTENTENAISESFSKIPQTLDISTQYALSSPLRAYRQLVCDYNRFTGAVSSLTNVLINAGMQDKFDRA